MHKEQITQRNHIRAPLWWEDCWGVAMRVCSTLQCVLPDQALKDFRERIMKYEEVYETITDRNLHYIKLIDM